ncbi:TonB-dependent receptor [Asticcacaulis sp. 201]|uniref:TonB-dependent receptor n=1 Tax=Asticcacaulis sp. 201 TaxID=3028787 RepID=UPI0029164AAC|nr:TonB-dependent receptor [Asticcacaulis sp. 201]MDV6332801.1 TonB-dependent receptor [Asticcacaulis sp. 201]
MQQAIHLLKTRALMAGVAGVALMTAVPVAAFAQTAAPAPAPAAQDDTVTVVVTAQKREQRLQDVPIVVTTLSAKLLQDAGVKDIKDMQILTPGLTVTSTQNETLTTARIRGVGTVGDNPGLESSVGVVIDGVYRPRNGVGFGDLGEMERIEVLKGPQGTLFGKNTSAGVINIITKKPSFTFGADGEATFGNYGAQGYAASVTGPIVNDLVAGRLYIAKRSHDGYTDVDTGVGPRTLKSDQDQDFTTIRGQLLFTPNSDSEIRVIGDFSHRDEYCCVAVQTLTGPTGAAINALAGGHGVAATANPDARLAYSNRDTHQVVRDGGVSVEGNFKVGAFGGSTFTTITGIRDWKATNGQDLDYSGADILYRKDNGDFNVRFKTFSQELRLAGATDKLNWLVGAFYVKEDMTRADSYVYGSAYEPYLGLLLSSQVTGTQDPTFVSKLTGRPYGTNFAAGAQARDHYTQSDESYALFTNNSWKVTEAVELTMGLRYTHEKKDMTALYTNSDSGAGCAAGLQKYGQAAAIMQAKGGNVTQSVIAGANPYWAGAIAAGKAPTLVGALCPFWSNPAFNNRRVSDSKANSNLSGTLKAAWHLNPTAMLYVSYARGYKAGGFNLDRAQTGITPDTDLTFAPETVDSYEVGLKTSLFNDALAVNVTAFDQRYQNFQLNTFLGTAFVVESIPSLTSKGFDADMYWRTPVPGLSFQGGISYADTKYGNFTAADLDNPAHFPGLSLLPGAQVSFAPKWTSSAALTWGHTFGNLRTSANLTAKYTSDYNTGSDLVPYKSQESYTLVNGRLSIGAADRSWTVEIWGQNLTDVNYRQVVINAPLQGTGFQSTVQTAGSNPGTYYNKSLDSNTYDAFLGAPKTYGVTLRVKY